jgi:hypothetical protein
MFPGVTTLGSLLFWALAGAASPGKMPVQLAQRLPFLCPRAEGVCSWSIGTGWKKVAPSSPDALVEFEQGVDGRVTVLLRGHGNPGHTMVVNTDGTVQAVRHNAREGNLQRLAGVDGAGNIVLCSETPEEARCDVFLPSRKFTAASPWFPDGCLFPRFLNDGSRACLRSFPNPSLLLVRGENQVQEISLPGELASPDDLHVLSATKFVFRVRNDLFIFEPGAKLREIARDGVLWSVVSNGVVLFGVCRDNEPGRRCSLHRYGPENGVTELWQSNVFVPALAYSIKGEVLLDMWGRGNRRLIRLPRSTGQQEEVLWKEHSDTLWQ